MSAAVRVDVPEFPVDVVRVIVAGIVGLEVGLVYHRRCPFALSVNLFKLTLSSSVVGMR